MHPTSTLSFLVEPWLNCSMPIGIWSTWSCWKAFCKLDKDKRDQYNINGPQGQICQNWKFSNVVKPIKEVPLLQAHNMAYYTQWYYSKILPPLLDWISGVYTLTLLTLISDNHRKRLVLADQVENKRPRIRIRSNKRYFDSLDLIISFG